MKKKPYIFALYALGAACALCVMGAVSLAKDTGSGNAASYYRETQAGSYLSGRFAQKNQDWRKASDYIGRLAVLDPGNAGLQEKAMILAMGSGDHARAFALARSILDQQPGHLWAVMFTATEALKHQDYVSAERLIAAAQSDDITGFINPILTTWIKAARGEIEGVLPDKNSLHSYHIILAAGFLKKLSALNPDMQALIGGNAFDPSELERLADVFAMAGQYEQAQRIYAALLQENPVSSVLGKKAERAEKKKPIDDLLTYAPITNPAQGVALSFYDLARIFYREYNDESAQIFAQMAHAIDPGMTQAKILLAYIQTRYNRYEDAISYYKSIERSDPNYITIQQQIADLLQETGRKEESILLLTRLGTEMGDVDSLIQLGDLYRREKQFDLAIKTYGQAFEKISADDRESRWSLYYVRGITYEQMGQWEPAEKDLRTALKYSPDNAYLLNYLGYGMADRGENLGEALDLIRKAVSLRPNDGFITDSLGWAYYQMGRYEDAVEPLERAVELQPYDPTINDHLGDAYWRVGRTLEAKFQWERALNHSEDDEQRKTLERKLAAGLDAAQEGGRSLSSAGGVSAPESVNP